VPPETPGRRRRSKFDGGYARFCKTGHSGPDEERRKRNNNLPSEEMSAPTSVERKGGQASSLKGNNSLTLGRESAWIAGVDTPLPERERVARG